MRDVNFAELRPVHQARWLLQNDNFEEEEVPQKYGANIKLRPQFNQTQNYLAAQSQIIIV